MLLLAAPTPDLCVTAGIRYMYFPEPMTFNQANAKCSQLGSGWTMAMPRTGKENQCVYDRKVKYEPAGLRGNVWLGFFRRKRRPYESVDGGSMGIQFWDSLHPKRIDHRTCALMWGKAPRAGEWGDGFCTHNGLDERIPVMCQQSKWYEFNIFVSNVT